MTDIGTEKTRELWDFNAEDFLSYLMDFREDDDKNKESAMKNEERESRYESELKKNIDSLSTEELEQLLDALEKVAPLNDAEGEKLELLNNYISISKKKSEAIESREVDSTLNKVSEEFSDLL